MKLTPLLSVPLLAAALSAPAIAQQNITAPASRRRSPSRSTPSAYPR